MSSNQVIDARKMDYSDVALKALAKITQLQEILHGILSNHLQK